MYHHNALTHDAKYGDQLCEFRYILRHEHRIKFGVDYTYLNYSDDGIHILSSQWFLSDVVEVALQLDIRIKQIFTI